MGKTLLGLAGAAAIVLGGSARAAEGDDAAKDRALQEESGRSASVMVHRERATSDRRSSPEAEPATPCDPACAGSASGEPSARDEARAASRAEFLRNVWTTP